MKIAKLGDICIIEKGKIGIQKATPGKFPLVVTAEERLTHNEFHFDANAVVVPLVSSTGHGHKSLKRIHFQSGKFALGNILCAIIPKDENVLNAEYLYRYLDLNREKELVNRMKGMANVTLPLKEIADIDIPLPPLKEQVKFIENYQLFESYKQGLSSELTHQQDLVKQMRQAFLREAMQGKLVKQDKKDGHAKDLLEKIQKEKKKLIKEQKIKKEKELPTIKPEEIPFELPENWVWCRLGNIIELQMGQSPEGHTYNKNGIGLPFYQGKTEFGVMYPKGVSVWCKQPKKVSAVNDILISVRAPVGDVNISDQVYAIGRGLSIVRVIKSTINYVFLFYFLDSIKRNWKAKGSFFDAVNRDKIEARLFPLPPLSEQNRIVKKLEELMKFCDGLQNNIQNSQQQNQQLLQQVLREALRNSN